MVILLIFRGIPCDKIKNLRGKNLIMVPLQATLFCNVTQKIGSKTISMVGGASNMKRMAVLIGNFENNP